MADFVEEPVTNFGQQIKIAQEVQILIEIGNNQ